MIRKELIEKENRNLILNIYDGDNWLFHQPFDPRDSSEITTEAQAEEIAYMLLNPPPPKPTYEELEKRLEVTENELLIAKGVI